MRLTAGRGPADGSTIADVAERAGVSKSAVSHVFNGRTDISAPVRDRILRAAEEVGWRPAAAASALAEARTRAVGYVVVRRDAHNLRTDPFFGEVIAGVQPALTERLFTLLVSVVGTVDEELAVYRRQAEFATAPVASRTRPDPGHALHFCAPIGAKGDTCAGRCSGHLLMVISARVLPEASDATPRSLTTGKVPSRRQPQGDPPVRVGEDRGAPVEGERCGGRLQYAGAGIAATVRATSSSGTLPKIPHSGSSSGARP